MESLNNYESITNKEKMKMALSLQHGQETLSGKEVDLNTLMNNTCQLETVVRPRSSSPEIEAKRMRFDTTTCDLVQLIKQQQIIEVQKVEVQKAQSDSAKLIEKLIDKLPKNNL